jgi:hypothetical protein
MEGVGVVRRYVWSGGSKWGVESLPKSESH